MSDPEIYNPNWGIDYCKSYAEQLRDKTRANRAEHAAECIEYLLSLVQKEWVGLTKGEEHMTKDNHIRIRKYEQAADEKVSLDGIKWLRKWDVCIQCDSAEEAEALRARLAQSDVTETNFGKMPETINMENFVGSGKPLVPVCWMNANDIDKTDWKVWAHGKPTVSMPLFTVPPKREWVGLTEEEIAILWKATPLLVGVYSYTAIALEVQAKLKEKNT